MSFPISFHCSQNMFAFSSRDLKDIVSDDDLRELQQIVVSTIASCSDKIVTNPADLKFAAKELGDMATGIAKVISDGTYNIFFTVNINP